MITTTLAAFPSPSQGVWHLGPIPIRAYAVFIIVGIIVALLIGDRRWAARGGERGVIYDIALWAVPFGLIGGRLYHVLTDWKTYFGPGDAGPIAALRIWDGGLGIWGAVALGGVGAWIACRRRGIPLPAFGDAVAPGIVLAQAIGRLGNYFNQELYGRETTLPWGMEIFYRRDPSGIVSPHSLNGVSTGEVFATVHPTFLYELLWNVLVFVILILVDRRFRIGHGRLFALYVALYCVGRFGVELLRDDPATTPIAGIRINSFTATFVFLAAVVYIILAKKGREDPRTLGGHEKFSEERVPVLAKELAAVASGTGVVAAATVAGWEDEETEIYEEPDALDVLATAEEVDSADEFEPLDESDEVVDDEYEVVDSEAEDAEIAAPEVPAAEADEVVEDQAEVVDPEADDAETAAPEVPAADEFVAESVDQIESDEAILSGDADDVEPDAEDESIIEAEAVSPGIEVETGFEGEEDVIDEDHDLIDEDEFEGMSEPHVTAAPVSEQQESLETADEVVEVDDAEADDDGALEVVDAPAAADSAEMVVVYASAPVSDGIVIVESEYASASDENEGSNDVDSELAAAVEATDDSSESDAAEAVTVIEVEHEPAAHGDESSDLVAEEGVVDEIEADHAVAADEAETSNDEPEFETDEASAAEAGETGELDAGGDPGAVEGTLTQRNAGSKRGSRFGRMLRRRR